MKLTTLGTLLTLAAAAVIAGALGGRLAWGVVAGALCGCAVAGLAAAWQRHVLRTRPERLVSAMAGSFLFKLAFVLMGALAFRYVPSAAERADWRSFLAAFAGAVLVVMLLATAETARLLRGAGAGGEDLEVL